MIKYKSNLIAFGVSALVTGLCIGFKLPLWIITFNAIALLANIIIFLKLNDDFTRKGVEE